MKGRADGEEISAEELADRVERGDAIDVLDVRNRDEVEAWAIEGPGVERHHVPHVKFVSAQVTGDAADLVDPATEYVVVCPRGEASAEVADTLREAGVDAANLAGGMEAWAGVYRATALPVDADGHAVLQFRRPATGCLAYALIADGAALVVDPLRAFTDAYVEAIEERGATIDAVLDTHVHADHLSGLRSLAEETGARQFLSETAADRGVRFDVETVRDGTSIAVGDATVDVRATPGHTSGSISLRCGDLLLTGDSLFVDGIPRPDLEAGAEGAADLARTLHETLTERFAPMDDDVFVAPGHYVPGTAPTTGGYYGARMGDLREDLAAFDESTGEFVERILESMGPRPANFERIVAANLGEIDLDEDDAFELELGPNNCAVGR